MGVWGIVEKHGRKVVLASALNKKHRPQQDDGVQ